MIGNHVAKGAGAIVIIAAKLYSQFFSDSDLHVIHIAAVPHRLENSIGEAECENILNGLFTEIMIDAIDLVFVQNFANIVVQSHRGGQIVAERLLYHHTFPTRGIDICQPRRA